MNPWLLINWIKDAEGTGGGGGGPATGITTESGTQITTEDGTSIVTET